MFNFRCTKEEPERPTFHAEEPEIFDIDVRVKTQGRYNTPSKRARGIIVHYTAGRPKADSTLKSMAKRGLGCLVMSEMGLIAKAKNQSLHEVAWHAGKSSHPNGKYSGMSRYCLGMEICCAGKLKQKGGFYESWFGEKYRDHEVRIVGDKDNMDAGVYHKYTEAQEKALFNFCLWFLRSGEFPDASVDWILGHDEVSGYRGKTDPGGSLSMTMPEFREKLRYAVKR